MHVIHAIGTAALWVCTLSALAFVVLYHLSAPWWRSAEGRHLMSFTGSLALVFIWVTYRSTVTPPARVLSLGDEIGRTVVYALIAVLLVWRLQLLWRRQINPALRHKEKGRR